MIIIDFLNEFCDISILFSLFIPLQIPACRNHPSHPHLLFHQKTPSWCERPCSMLVLYHIRIYKSKSFLLFNEVNCGFTGFFDRSRRIGAGRPACPGNESVFSGGVNVGENTSQPGSVRVVVLTSSVSARFRAEARKLVLIHFKADCFEMDKDNGRNEKAAFATPGGSGMECVSFDAVRAPGCIPSVGKVPWTLSTA